MRQRKNHGFSIVFTSFAGNKATQEEELYKQLLSSSGEGHMTLAQIDGLVQTLLPKVLSDPDLGNGRTFTSMHLRHLWALSCLYAEECYDEQTVELCVARHLPPNVLMVREVAAF